ADRAETGRVSEGPRCEYHRLREPRGGVHRQVEADEIRVPHCLIAQALLGEVDAVDAPPRRPQPRRGRREAERLAAHFVGTNQECPHHSYFVAGPHPRDLSRLASRLAAYLATTIHSVTILYCVTSDRLRP